MKKSNDLAIHVLFIIVAIILLTMRSAANEA